MSSSPHDPHDDPRGGPSSGPPSGRGTVQPTPPGAPVALGLVALVVGWLARPVIERFGATAPLVTWGQPLALLLVAGILGLAAWVTHRSVHVHHERLAPHQAVNRLLLARACVLVGALVAGLYGGYAIAWLGLDAELAGQRALRSGVAALAGLLICVSSVLLERACRIRDDGTDP